MVWLTPFSRPAVPTPVGNPRLRPTNRHRFEPRFTFPWSALEEVAIRVELCLPEAWWDLRGAGREFSGPVEMVYNAAALNERLFALPGFDRAAYAGRRAEQTGEEREFICWRKPKHRAALMVSGPVRAGPCGSQPLTKKS